MTETSTGDARLWPVDRPALRAALLIAAMSLGVAAALVSLPRIFPMIPNDLSRIGTVRRALRSGRPQIVIFGDSRAEAAVDAAQLRRQLPGQPLAYNLAWHAQDLGQSFLLYDELPRSTSVVVQVVSLEDLGSPGTSDPRVYRAMRAYGFHPRREIIDQLQQDLGASAIAALRESDLHRRLTSRWVLPHLFDTVPRLMLRRDLRLERERTDLFFPNAYTTRVDEARFVEIKRIFQYNVEPAAICEPKQRLLRSIVSLTRAHRLRVVLLLPPVHPAATSADRPRRLTELRAFCASVGLEVLDVSAAEDSEFVDPVHVSENGARRATSLLAAYLRGSR